MQISYPPFRIRRNKVPHRVRIWTPSHDAGAHFPLDVVTQHSRRSPSADYSRLPNGIRKRSARQHHQDHNDHSHRSRTSRSPRTCSSRSRLVHDNLLLPLQPRAESPPPSMSSNPLAVEGVFLSKARCAFHDLFDSSDHVNLGRHRHRISGFGRSRRRSRSHHGNSLTLFLPGQVFVSCHKRRIRDIVNRAPSRTRLHDHFSIPHRTPTTRISCHQHQPFQHPSVRTKRPQLCYSMLSCSAPCRN